MDENNKNVFDFENATNIDNQGYSASGSRPDFGNMNYNGNQNYQYGQSQPSEPAYKSAPGAFDEPPFISPKKSGGAAKKIGKAFLSLMLVAAISVGSISGYVWYQGRINPPFQPAASTGTTNATNPAAKTNYTLGTSETALTSQEIFVKAVPWVVSIATEVEVSGGGGYGFPGFGGTAQASGTGVVMTADGYIITNHHVVEDATSIRVTVYGGQEYEATVTGMDEKTDIAVIKINATGLAPAEFGDSTELVVGEPAIVIGNPLGIEYADTMTQGIISSTERTVPFTDSSGSQFYMTLIQTDAAVSPGNSGGPMINCRGQVVGIINSKIAAENVEGIAFAVPTDIALDIANDLVVNGTVTTRPMLGITVLHLTEQSAQQYNALHEAEIKDGTLKARTAGLFIESISEGGTAASSDLKVGDQVTAFNGVKVSTYAELNYEKEKCRIGESASVTVIRDGQELNIDITFMGGDAT